MQPVHTMSAKPKKGAAKKVSVPHSHQHGHGHDTLVVMTPSDRGGSALGSALGSPVGTMEQRDRSLTVMIPRAKYRAVPATSTLAAPLSTFTAEPERVDPHAQHKLLAYLEGSAGPSTSQAVPQVGSGAVPQAAPPHSRKQSAASGASAPPPPPPPGHRKGPAPRKPSSTGALVSAGFEVSATVGRPLGHQHAVDDDVSDGDVDDLHYHADHRHHHDHRFDTQRTRVGDR